MASIGGALKVAIGTRRRHPAPKEECTDKTKDTTRDTTREHYINPSHKWQQALTSNLQGEEDVAYAHGQQDARDTACTSAALHILEDLPNDGGASHDTEKRRQLGEVELGDSIRLHHGLLQIFRNE